MKRCNRGHCFYFVFQNWDSRTARQRSFCDWPYLHSESSPLWRTDVSRFSREPCSPYNSMLSTAHEGIVIRPCVRGGTEWLIIGKGCRSLSWAIIMASTLNAFVCFNADLWRDQCNLLLESFNRVNLLLKNPCSCTPLKEWSWTFTIPFRKFCQRTH